MKIDQFFKSTPKQEPSSEPDECGPAACAGAEARSVLNHGQEPLKESHWEWKQTESDSDMQCDIGFVGAAAIIEDSQRIESMVRSVIDDYPVAVASIYPYKDGWSVYARSVSSQILRSNGRVAFSSVNIAYAY